MREYLDRAVRTFTMSDQNDFADLSGDHNPIHVDAIAARRLMFGGPVVHGVHVAVWAIGEQGKSLPPRTLNACRIRFMNPVLVGSTTECRWAAEASSARIEIWCEDKVVTRIELAWSHESHGGKMPADQAPPREVPQDLGSQALDGVHGTVPLLLARSAALRLLPEAMRQLPASQIAWLLATTRTVGSKCPGLHSIYSSLKLERRAEMPVGDLEFAVVKVDSRFGSVSLQLEGGDLTGTASVFIRPPPASQRGYGDIAKGVNTGEFEGLTALVVGGSRGLGEVAVKILCAGGGKVIFTYFSGKRDAHNLVQEISIAGGTVSAMKLDVTAALPAVLPEVDVLVYTSTPFIFSASKGKFSKKLFGDFCEHYVNGFSRICLGVANGRALKVLSPSSSAVDEIPANMGEYAAAKAAAEILCGYLERCNSGIRIHRPRLSRMATDQAASILQVHNADPVPIMLKELRSLIEV